MNYYIGTDIGGTFTDCVILNDKGKITISKAPSTPPNFSIGLMNALEAAAQQMGTEVGELLKRTRIFSHGCTVATNTLINRSGAKVGLITTKGFEETLYMMRGSAYCQGLPVEDWYHKPLNERPFDLVPTEYIVGITERIDKHGEVVVRIREDEVKEAAEYLIDKKGCEAISISFLWSFLNPAHEKKAKQILEELYPDVYIDASHEILSLIGEYERFSTTAINSYVRPEVEKYITDLKKRLEKNRLKGPFYLMQANGGLVGGQEAVRQAVRLLQSGPTGGVIAGKIISELIGSNNVITGDMGGTSFDISLITDGEINYTVKSYHERHVVATPMVDIESIGAGGGSIAYIEHGILKVGPQSAGSVPGPVCYDRGGQKPTVTDANLVLGYLNPEYFIGGKLKLNKVKAQKAIKEQIADPLGISVVEAADGIYRIVNSHMSDAMRFHVLKRGYDPRNFDLFLFGGATPAHAVGIGEDLNVKSIIVPFAGLATVLSAFGIVNSDIVRFYTSSYSIPLSVDRIGELNSAYKELEKIGLQDLISEGFHKKDIKTQRIASMRYHLQLTDIDVEIGNGELTQDCIEDITNRFDRRYAELYGESAGFKEAGRDVISQFVKMMVSTPKGKIEPLELASSDPCHALKGTREAYFTNLGFVKTEIFDGDRLKPGNRVTGPSILEMMGTTVVIPPDYVAELDEYRNIIIKKLNG